MKKTFLILLAVLSLAVAKENRQAIQQQAGLVHRAENENQSSGQIQTRNKFTHPLKVNQNYSPNDKVRNMLENDLSNVLHSLQQIQKPINRQAADVLNNRLIRKNQNPIFYSQPHHTI